MDMTSVIVDTGMRDEAAVPAVKILNAHKRYGNGRFILDGLNMTAPKGCIYGLLGPSGCGKTTLLRCIMGRINLDMGTIELQVKKRKQIGYMLQEVALQGYLSVGETFDYFGRLFAIRKSEREARSGLLRKLLQLPGPERIVNTLSGGQQRRMSFAVCLLHDPQLLILDEPTVGLDPLLRETIWEHLMKLSKEGKTIIITTHYIEEASEAHVVGLMRGGRLLDERDPVELKRESGCSSLEEAFLQLCCREEIAPQSEEQDPSKDEDMDKKVNRKSSASNHLASETVFNYNRFWAQFTKHILWMKRNLLMFVFLMLMPAVCSYLSHELYLHKPSDLNVGLVNAEVGDPGSANELCSRQTAHVASPPCFENSTMEEEDYFLSCWYYEHARTSSELNVKWVNSEEEARHLVEKGKLWAYMKFPGNFSEAFKQRILLGRFINDDLLDSAFVQLSMDMSNSVKADYLRLAIIRTMQDLMDTMSESCEAPVKVGHIPVRFEDAIFLTNEHNYVFSGQPAMFLPFLFYLSLVFTVSHIMMEKNTMLLERSLSAGMSFTETVVAHLFHQLVIVGLQTIIMIIFCYVIYKNPMLGSFALVLFLMLLVNCLAVSYGYLLCFIFRSESIAAFAATGSIVVLLTICTILWPIQGMHWLLRTAIQYFPVVPAIVSFQSIALRGWSIFHPLVYYGLLQTVVWIFLVSLLAYLFYRYSEIVKNR